MFVEFFAVFFIIFVFVLLTGTSKRVKVWFGTIYTSIAIIFITGSLVVRFRTSYFKLSEKEWIANDGQVKLGDWVIPFYLIGAALLLILIDYRFYQKASESDGTSKWMFIILGSLFSLFYCFSVLSMLLAVAFMFYPFAP
ncbi:hypothetical protein [Bacillus solimangrovi]|uniref:Uncharacterized protein n=1 Tax=Bacillus solimangrovi TaxID=1305675 RepID=A0A1E5LFS1_9BACI|nr:hypothetical protein [Bacillus solimangrovi]OEH92906.1 hypothetical protein BFG57_14630 [Bacillus solimangrovi]